MECEVYSGIDGSHLLGTLRKGSCQNEYPHHQHDIFIGSSYRELIDALFQIQSPCDGDGIARRDEEGHRYRNFVEIVHQDGGDQIEAQEYE